MWKVLTQRSFLQQWYIARNELERLLMGSCAFSIALAGVRILYTGQYLFLSLIWNLWLAYIPYALSKGMSHPKRRYTAFSFSVLSLVWLLFIPNSFYIITDLFHLKETEAVPFWFDLALLFSFAWNGLVLGVLSVRHMEKLVGQWVRFTNEWYFIYPVMLLNALGIFIGRYWRYNSWDIVTNPFALIHDIAIWLLHPVRYRFDWGMIVCFSVLMTLLYSTLKKISKAIG